MRHLRSIHANADTMRLEDAADEGKVRFSVPEEEELGKQEKDAHPTWLQTSNDVQAVQRNEHLQGTKVEINSLIILDKMASILNQLYIIIK